MTDATHAAWRKADDILTISKAEIQAVEPPRVAMHDERLYTNDNLLRIISEEKCVKGVAGMSEDWRVRQQGVPLWNKLRWAITEGIKIYEYACENHQDMMDRAEELIASVGEEYRVTVTRRLTKGWQEQGIPKTWRPVLDVWHEQEEKLKAAAAAREKRNKKKEKKDKRKRLEAEEEDEEVPAQEPGVTGNATDVQERAMQRRSHKLQEERTKKQSAEEAEELKRLVEAEESEEGKDAAAAKYLIKVTGYSEEDCAELIRMEKVNGVSTIQAYHRAVSELNQAQQECYRTLAEKDAELEKCEVELGVWYQNQVNKRQPEAEGAADAVGADTNKGTGTDAGAMVPNPLIRIAGSEIYVSREALAAAGTGTDSGSGTGVGAGSGKPVYSAEFAAGMEAGPERPEDERETRRNKREVQRAQALKADEVRQGWSQKSLTLL